MRKRTRFAALLAIGALLAIPIAGCGGDDDDDDGGEAATPAATATTTGGGGGGETVDMSATDFKFDPSDPTVKSGEVTFVLKNDGQTTHSMEIEDVNGQDVELEGEVAAGDSGTLKANLSPGTYEFYCPVDGHKEQGMTGEITVQ
jgi:uncharacterized cupredoxin-like copper-binding protein